MGCSWSCRSWHWRGVKKKTSNSNSIRVVHLSGFVQDFEGPVSVTQVIGTDPVPKHFLCTPAQLLSHASNLPLQPHTLLQAGHVYFSLPYSILQSDVSPVALATLARKLTAKAKVNNTASTTPGSALFMPCSPQRLSRMRPWKPVLQTIREMSFNRRSESDLQET
ncbi:hypothetical protein HRI_001778100 [Hibiscus trionum]|uniref:Uncharacterized protein n=1 Tax=Hibiscus trionum TaxID=183268 RepID=A0A9W7HPD3_HIBTR|nr:hypothetical protein HRI_001778100 [Hibiscus trionum]